MYRPRFIITPLILNNIEQISRILGFLSAVRLSTAYAQELIAEVEAEMVHASTAIEGNTLTREQVTRLLRGQTVRAIARDVQEVKNYQETLRYIRDIAQHTARFSQQTILDLHYRLLRGVNDAIAGKYRAGLVRVGDYQPPKSFELHAAMSDFVDWLNHPTPEGYSPLLYAGIAHYQLVAIHPFKDGNGRTTRALTTLYLLKQGYDITQSFALESYYNRERTAYYDALGSADVAVTGEAERDVTAWLEYFTTGMLTEAAHAESRIREQVARQGGAAAYRLNPTQQTLVRITQEKGVAQMADFAAVLPISARGIRKALQRLVELGVLEQTGSKRGTYYRLATPQQAAR